MLVEHLVPTDVHRGAVPAVVLEFAYSADFYGDARCSRKQASRGKGWLLDLAVAEGEAFFSLWLSSGAALLWRQGLPFKTTVGAWRWSLLPDRVLREARSFERLLDGLDLLGTNPPCLLRPTRFRRPRAQPATPLQKWSPLALLLDQSWECLFSGTYSALSAAARFRDVQGLRHRPRAAFVSRDSRVWLQVACAGQSPADVSVDCDVGAQLHADDFSLPVPDFLLQPPLPDGPTEFTVLRSPVQTAGAMTLGPGAVVLFPLSDAAMLSPVASAPEAVVSPWRLISRQACSEALAPHLERKEACLLSSPRWLTPFQRVIAESCRYVIAAPKNPCASFRTTHPSPYFFELARFGPSVGGPWGGVHVLDLYLPEGRPNTETGLRDVGAKVRAHLCNVSWASSSTSGVASYFLLNAETPTAMSASIEGLLLALWGTNDLTDLKYSWRHLAPRSPAEATRVLSIREALKRLSGEEPESDEDASHLPFEVDVPLENVQDVGPSANAGVHRQVVSLPPDALTPAPLVAECSTTHLRNQEFVDHLKSLYKGSCQVCGYAMSAVDGTALVDVHHIWPLGLEGPDVQENLIVLCPNHHREFDNYLLAIDPRTLGIVSTTPSHPYAGRALQMESSHLLDITCLRFAIARQVPSSTLGVMHA